MKKILSAILMTASLSSFAQPIYDIPYSFTCEETVSLEQVTQSEKVIPQLEILKALPEGSCGKLHRSSCGQVLMKSYARFEMVCVDQKTVYKLLVKTEKIGKKNPRISKVRLTVKY